MKVSFFLYLALLLANCSTGNVLMAQATPTTANPQTPTPTSIPAATSLLVIGNSLAQHGPDLTIGWSSNWGMAATTEGHDFAHLSAVGLKLPVTIINGSPAEQDPTNKGATVLQQTGTAITPATLVVLELGENVTVADTVAFQPIFDRLAKQASGGRAFVCLSTYWLSTALDQQMQASCNAYGGKFVSIGDIFTDPKNPDYQGSPTYSNPGVNRHPHDWSMQQIATRVIAAGLPAASARQ